MIIGVATTIYVEVADQEQGESACATLQRGLAQQLGGFPDGEIIDAEVDHFTPLSEAEIKEKGFDEE